MTTTTPTAAETLAALNNKTTDAATKAQGPNEYFDMANAGIEVYVQTAKGAFIKASTIRRSTENYAKHPIQEKLIQKALNGDVDADGFVEIKVKIKVVAGVSASDIEL